MLTTLPLRQLHQVSEWAITISKGTFSFQEEKIFSPGSENFLSRKRIFSFQEENIFFPGREYFLSWNGSENFLHLERKMTRETFYVITKKVSSPGKKYELRKHFHRTQETISHIQRNISSLKFLLGQCRVKPLPKGESQRSTGQGEVQRQRLTGQAGTTKEINIEKKIN